MFCSSLRVGITTVTDALPGGLSAVVIEPGSWIEIDKYLTTRFITRFKNLLYCMDKKSASLPA
jgi:hypothetical protein